MRLAAGISGTGEETLSAVEKPMQSAVPEKAEVEKPVTKKKRRLDEICSEQHPEYSRNVIQSWIAQGRSAHKVHVLAHSLGGCET
jgi:hypothetical protein